MKQQGSAGGSLPEASRSVQASSGISCNVGGPLVVQQCNMDSVKFPEILKPKHASADQVARRARGGCAGLGDGERGRLYKEMKGI